MLYIILLTGIALLIVLITGVKLNPFVSFLVVCVLIGLATGMNTTQIANSIQKGVGDILGSLVAIIGLGSMLGKLVADSGAAQRIANGLVKSFGKKNLVWALVVTAFIIGIPLFYNVAFVIFVPLIIGISTRYKLPAVYIGLPAMSALSVTHGYLPPHPSPVALVQQFHADLGLTLLYGMIVAIPAIILAGPVFATTLKNYTNKPLDTFATAPIPEEELPSMFASIFTAFLPVILIAAASLFQVLVPGDNTLKHIVVSLGEPLTAMLITVIIAIYTLGIRRGKSMKQIGSGLTDAIKDIAMIMFIIGGAGGLKQILTDTGISEQIAASLQTMQLHPLFVAWTIAAIIRVCVGSATVAGLTTAGIVAPLIASSGVNPCLMVLATGAGSLMFSHVNDPGFWLFKEYFNLSFKQTIKTWSIMETIVSVVGLIGVFVLNYFVK
ncbi:gluconate:H+ symporter [Foetidibacter luteolus]|uniref:gluconate:H+ symporter n=1 Tax=Foetidibacter luteolus TaxID=2608880 RepID=UPI00129AA98B|nr:gluconate:H+ symporter [Foetidibacter luteolus]